MKGKKSASELEAMIMQEVRKHPDWSHVQGVAITRSVQEAPHHASWGAAFIIDGPRIAPAEAFQLARELATKFDLA
jgi:hypothetical protein